MKQTSHLRTLGTLPAVAAYQHMYLFSRLTDSNIHYVCVCVIVWYLLQ